MNYLMAHVDPQRTGWNPNETLLTPANVTINNTVSNAHNFNTPTAGFFGEIWNSPQFANAPDCWATPLYVDSVTLTSSVNLINPAYAGDTLSVAYCGTGKCDLYAVCASGAIIGSTIIPPGTILWHKNLGSAAVSIDGTNVGIFGTPIIDLNATPPTMYVATCTTPQAGWNIYAIDITNGTILPNWPVAIKNTTVQPVMQNGGAIPPTFSDTGLNDACRGALNLSADGTTLFVPISDVSTVTGFMVTVATNGTPHVASCFSTVANPPNGGSGDHYAGLWSAAGASLDSAGNCFVCTGDCPIPATQFNADQDRLPGYWGMTMLVFNPPTPANPALSLHGTYNAWNYQSMDFNDVDIASTPIIIPDLPGPVPHTTAYGAKNGNLYFVNRDALNTTTVTTNMRPAAIGAMFRSDIDETGLVSPLNYTYYTNSGATPDGATGPLNVFGPYSEGGNNVGFAKARTSPSVFQGPDSNYYLVYTGSTKIAAGQQPALPPCVARIKINTSNANPYLTIDGTESTQVFESPGSSVISSNGNQNAVAWMLDTNRYRGNGVSGCRPYLVGVEAMTMKTIYKSAVSATTTDSNNGPSSTLHSGGKYNEPSVARGKVFVGTDRLQAFGVTSYVYAIGAGGSGGPGDTTTTLSPVLPTGVVGTSPDGKKNITTTTVGKTYTTDAFLNNSGGTPSPGTTNAIDVTSVSNPAPAAVYQHARIGVTGTGTPSGGFTYTFPNLIPGATYSVRLHFCETIVTASNRRRFNVSINGTQVLSNYDIFSTATAQFIACEEPFAAVADPTTGTITVAFSPGSVSVPMVSAIEVNALPNSVTQEYFFDWQAQYGLIGTLGNPAADSSGDGIPNAWKYFTAANPSQHGDRTTLLPQFSQINTGGSNYLQFTYLRRIDYASRGFSLAVQTSPDLSPGSWSTQPAAQVGTPVPTGDGVTETAVIRLNSAVPTGTAKLFARVQLTLAN